MPDLPTDRPVDGQRHCVPIVIGGGARDAGQCVGLGCGVGRQADICENGCGVVNGDAIGSRGPIGVAIVGGDGDAPAFSFGGIRAGQISAGGHGGGNAIDGPVKGIGDGVAIVVGGIGQNTDGQVIRRGGWIGIG